MTSFLHFDPAVLIETFGYVGLFIIVFAESGFLLGFFFPGDSLLFTAGLLASQGLLHIESTVALVVVAAIAGDSFGYWFGAKAGPRIFTREDSLFFHKKHIERTRKFYLKYGARAVIIARFVPVVRTFTPILAGVGSMPYRTFARYNIIGGTLWGAGMTLLGYFLGTLIPGIDHYLLPIVLAIIVISFFPIAREVIKGRNEKEE